MKTILTHSHSERPGFVNRGASRRFRLQTSHFRFPRQRIAFTLNELLVVMALLILILAIAIPAFSLITSGKSIESAENQVSAFFGATRADAIGLQDPRGVLMFIDQANNRVTMLQVWFPPGARPTLEIYPGKDEMVLPAGVGFRMIPNGVPPANADNWPRFGVIMFDGDGRLLLDFANVATGTQLATRLTTVVTTNPDMPPVPTPANTQTNIGFLLFDKGRHDEQPTANRQKWFQENAVPYLVNRYNGTLMRGQ